MGSLLDGTSACLLWKPTLRFSGSQVTHWEASFPSALKIQRCLKRTQWMGKVSIEQLPRKEEADLWGWHFLIEIR